MWNVFDTAFLAIFCVYLVLRIRGIVNGDCMLSCILLKVLILLTSISVQAASSELAFDILACGACILLPRFEFINLTALRKLKFGSVSQLGWRSSLYQIQWSYCEYPDN